MKKTLLSAIVLMTLSTLTSSGQPCTFGNIGIKINSEVSGPGNTCIVNFDMYFDIDHNAGGKYFWFHLWPASQYTQYNYAANKAPTSANGGLANSVLTFGFNHFQNNLVPMSSYLPDPGILNFQGGYTLSEIQGILFDRYTAKGLNLTLPQSCNMAQPLLADAWQTQAENGNNIHCFTTQTPVILNDPTITGGLLFCEMPRSYIFRINTSSTTPREVSFKVVIDNGDGIFNASMDTLQINSGTASISSTAPFNSTRLAYPPYNSTKPYSDRDLWVVLLKNTTDIPNDIYAQISNSCIPLPVDLIRFTVQRNKSAVVLNWTTASENNNKGFFIERSMAGGNWQTIGFMQSGAFMGNSATQLDYAFADPGPLTGLVQYRLHQVDIDEKSTYSDIRILKGLDQAAAIRVFPNPTNSGEITLALDKAGLAADIALFDMNGRVTRQWNHFTGNLLRIQAISSGSYLLSVWINGEKEPQMLKVVVTQ